MVDTVLRCSRRSAECQHSILYNNFFFMPQSKILPAVAKVPGDSGGPPSRLVSYLPLFLVALGFLLRFGNAAFRFLNADEALHYLLSVQPSLAAAYKASLTTVHPPLLIIFLHYWGMLGHSELFLRLPSVLAGTAFCWIMFAWLKRVTNNRTALIGLVLFLFSPALVQTSTEVRQYPLLWLFCASSLYFLERGFEDDSGLMVLGSGIALYLALLTHYSALIFAFTLGAYASARFLGAQFPRRILLSWMGVQLVGLAICALLYRTHISVIRSNGQTESVTSTYLSRSVLSVHEHIFTFIFRSDIRLFHYLFSQEVVGFVALALFLAGLVWLVRDRGIVVDERLRRRQMAFLFVFPLFVNCALGLLRIYPYGGTRHNSYLAMFVFPAIAIALEWWRPVRAWWKPASLAAVLTVCNLFPTPLGEFMRLRNQKRGLMTQAVNALRSASAHSTIFTDDQGGLLLSYYMCGDRKVVQIEQPVFRHFMTAQCGDRSVISIDPDWWIFKTATFPDTMREVQQTYRLKPGTPLVLFQAGWFIDRQSALHKEYEQYGCTQPKNFGQNIFMCPIRVGEEP